MMLSVIVKPLWTKFANFRKNVSYDIMIDIICILYCMHFFCHLLYLYMNKDIIVMCIYHVQINTVVYCVLRKGSSRTRNENFRVNFSKVVN